MKFGKGVYVKFKKGISISTNLHDFSSFEGDLMDWIYRGEFEDDEIYGQGALESQDYVLKGFFLGVEVEGDYVIYDKTKGCEI